MGGREEEGGSEGRSTTAEAALPRARPEQLAGHKRERNAACGKRNGRRRRRIFGKVEVHGSRGRIEYGTHNQLGPPSRVPTHPFSWRPRFLMPSAFVWRANPKFGVEKEEGARKGVNFSIREDKKHSRKDGMFYLPLHQLS